MEFAIVGVFVLVGVDAGVAAGISILDRAISYWGLMAVWAVVYVVSGKKQAVSEADTEQLFYFANKYNHAGMNIISLSSITLISNRFFVTSIPFIDPNVFMNLSSPFRSPDTI